MDSGKKYFTNIVDYIDSKYIYSLECNKGISGKYNLYATVKTGQWEKNFILINDTDISSEKNEKKLRLTIGQQINLSSYDLLIDDINKELGVSDEKAILVLNYNFTTQERFGHSIEIPLKSKTIQINESLTKDKRDIIRAEVRKEINYYSVTLFSLLMVGILFAISLTSKIKIKEIEEINIKKILDQYKSLIVEGIVLSEGGNIMVQQVKSINDLVKVADDLIKPIIHVKDGDKDILYILDVNIKYEFIL